MMNRVLRYFCSVFLLLSAFCINADDGLNTQISTDFAMPGPIVERYTKVGDTTFNVLYRLFQDSRGFLWLGTEEGVIRFDGYNTLSFAHQQDNPKSLSKGMVLAIEEDAQGYLWFATFGGGLNRFDSATATFTRYSHAPEKDNTISSNRILDMVVSQDNHLWLATDKGVDRFNPISGSTQRKTQSFDLIFNGKPQPIMSIYEDTEGYLWISGRANGVFRYHPKKHHSIQYRHNKNDLNSLDSDAVKKVYQDSKGDIWVATNKGMNRINLPSNRVERFSLPVKARNTLKALNLRSIIEDSKQRVWIGSIYNGLLVFNRQTQQFEEVNNNADVVDAFDSMSATQVIEDQSGAIWVATIKNGLFKITTDAMRFLSITASAKQSLRIGALFKDSSDNIWVSANNKLHLYNQENHQMIVKMAFDGHVDEIVQAGDGRLILSMYDHGIFYFDPVSLVMTKAPDLPHNSIQTIALDQQNTLWVALGMGPGRKGAGFYRLKSGANAFELVKDNVGLTTIVVLPSGKLLLSGRRNSYIYQSESNLWSELQDGNQPVSAVWTMQKGRNGDIWVGTQQQGIGQLNLADNSLSVVDQSQGLPSNLVRTLAADSYDRLWVGTANGLASYDSQSKEIKTFGYQQGSRMSAFSNINNGVVTSDGDILMADETQLIRFSPDELLKPSNLKQDNRVLLTELKVLNEVIEPGAVNSPVNLLKTINHTDTLTLTYKDYLFSLSFVATNYNQQNQLTYAYLMEGLDEQWIAKSNDERNATFTSLSPGDYQFKYKVSDSAGNFGESFSTLKLKVTPPWWRTWSAYLVYVLLLSITVVVFYKWKTRNLLKRAEELEQGVIERTDTINSLLEQKKRLFANISHEFRTPLTLILSPVDMLIKQDKPHPSKRQLGLIKRNGVRLLRMVDQLLEFAKLEQDNKERSEIVSLANTLEIIVASFDTYAKEHQLKLFLSPFDDVKLAVLPDSMNKILINLISNACKYTPAGGQVKVLVENQQDWVCIEVNDDGPGIDEKYHDSIFERFNRSSGGSETSVSGSGIGLALVKELTEANGGSIALKSALGQGSSFMIKLPIDQGDRPSETSALMDTQQSIREHLEFDLQVEVSNEVKGISETALTDIEDDGKKVVLIVEDHADMRDLLNQQLQQRYHVIMTENGKEGLNVARKHLPDLIISDVMMPVMDGYELTSMLKKDVLTSHIPVMLLTAKGSLENRIKGLQLLVDDYLAKPFHVDELQLRVNNLITIREIVKKRFSEAINSNNPLEMVESLGLSKVDQGFMAQVEQQLENLYADAELNQAQLARCLELSDRQLARKLKSVFDLTFSEMVRNFRLGKATQLLLEGQRSSTVCFDVGFSSQSYFSRCFKARYGENPKDYRQLMLQRPDEQANQ